MLALLSPLDAYRADLFRNPGLKDFGRTDTIWLLVSHCLSRLSRTGQPGRQSIAEYCAVALRELEEGADEAFADDRELMALLGRLREGLAAVETREGANLISQSIRALADSMGDAGAFSLSFSTLGHLRASVPAASARERGMILTEQARASRLLGDLDTADDLYELAGELASVSHEPEVEVRSVLGRAVVARVRGNYPRARTLFRDGLERADAASLPELAGMAHQGLLIAAGVAGDLDTALVHGWAAYEMVANDEQRQAEMLVNLAHLSMLAGYHAAALRGFIAAMNRTTAVRARVPALGSAAEAAARLGNAELVDSIARVVEALATETVMPYEIAQALKSLSTAYSELGRTSLADDFRRRARDIARKGGFFEIIHGTEPKTEAANQRRGRSKKKLTEPSYRVIESLASLEGDPAETVLALTRAG
jgi:tetratricopeptide (TPR) repeat protein